MRRRYRERTRLPLPDVKRLETWTLQRKNAILLIDTYIPRTAKTFMVDLIDLILENGMPIVWALRFADYMNRRMSVTDIIRTLVLQTMQASAEELLNSPFPVTVEQLRGAASVSDWVAIFRRLLSSIGHVFIALDADLLAHVTEHERGLALEMLDILRSELSDNVKIVLAMSSVTRAYAEELEHLDACVRIQTGNRNWRNQRRQRRPNVRFRGR